MIGLQTGGLCWFESVYTRQQKGGRVVRSGSLILAFINSCLDKLTHIAIPKIIMRRAMFLLIVIARLRIFTFF